MHDARGGVVQLRAAHAAFPSSVSLQGQLERDEAIEGDADLRGWYVVVGAANEGDVGLAVVDLGLEQYADVSVEPDDDDGSATLVATTAGGARLEIVALGGEDPG